MASIQDIQDLLKRVPPFIISESRKKDIVEKSNIYFELRTFIMSKYGIDEVTAEERFKDFYKDRIPKVSIPYLMDVVIEYSQSEGFDKHSELVDNTSSIKSLVGSLLNFYK